MDIADMRVDYRCGRLRREDLKADPIEQFQLWLEEADWAGITEPTAMSLATAGSDGRSLLRTVLLKGFDNRGFVSSQTWKVAKRGTLAKTRMLVFSSHGSCSNAKSS